MKYPLLLVLGLLVKITFAQTSVDPKITGDTILCPNESGELTTTEVYDTYQWYFRGYNDTTWKQFGNGGDQRTISISEKHVLNYFKVEVTDGGQLAESDSVLVDQYVFLLPTVKSAGDFSVGNNGEAEFCAGDTMYFILNAPYDTNITWFRNTNIIPKENDDTLLVKESGNYTVSGAPGVCPDYIVSLGLQIEVIKFEPKQPHLIQRNDSLIITNKDTFQSFTWYRDGQEILTNFNFYHIPDSTGDFYVETTDINGCQSISDTIAYQPSGVDDPVESGLQIYPNPVHDNLQISTGYDGPAIIRIYDSSGRLVKQKQINSATAQLDVSILSNGIHLIQVELDEVVLSDKILIE